MSESSPSSVKLGMVDFDYERSVLEEWAQAAESEDGDDSFLGTAGIVNPVQRYIFFPLMFSWVGNLSDSNKGGLTEQANGGYSYWVGNGYRM